MPDKRILERAEYNGELVTILNRGRLQSEIRNGFGYVQTVPTRDLSHLPDEDERKTITVVTD
jgi:hypothetical protein